MTLTAEATPQIDATRQITDADRFRDILACAARRLRPRRSAFTRRSDSGI